MPDGTNALYRYDHAGRRTQESINSTVTHFLWDEISPYGDVIAEYDATSTPQAHYTLADGQLLAQTRGADTHFYLQDGQMSVRMLADETGTVTDSYDYDAFGEIDAQTGTTPNAYLYTGQQYDAETGLYSLRARYYNPADGRFLSRDSYAYNYQNPFELNRYSYAANNPTNGYDPTGHFLIDTSAMLQSINWTRTFAAGIGGFVSGSLMAFITYFMASTGACGDDARAWASLIDPKEFALTSAGVGAVSGAIFSEIGPVASVALTAGGAAVSAANHGTEAVVDSLEFTGCALVKMLTTLTKDLPDASRGVWDENILVVGAIAAPTAASGYGIPLGAAVTGVGTVSLITGVGYGL
ncbi:MAG: RHS repeat-associated core domain-containing protein, partial [Taibaiella sp.]|nr:RHS repeat-associated core domain-containing protein [Taibaiella sp.]